MRILYTVLITICYCMGYSQKTHIVTKNESTRTPVGISSEDDHSYVSGFIYNNYTYNTSSLSYNLNRDIFLAKYSHSGDKLWEVNIYIDTLTESCELTGLESFDGVIISGTFSGKILFGQSDSLISDGHNDGFVASYDINGNKRWIKHIKGEDNQGVDLICPISDSVLMISGSFRNMADIDGDTSLYGSRSGDNIFLLWVDEAGNNLDNKILYSSGRNCRMSSAAPILGGSVVVGSFSDTIIINNSIIKSDIKLSGIIISINNDYNISWYRIIRSGSNNVFLTGVRAKDSLLYVTGDSETDGDYITYSDNIGIRNRDIIGKDPYDFIFYKINLFGSYVEYRHGGMIAEGTVSKKNVIGSDIMTVDIVCQGDLKKEIYRDSLTTIIVPNYRPREIRIVYLPDNNTVLKYYTDNKDYYFNVGVSDIIRGNQLISINGIPYIYFDNDTKVSFRANHLVLSLSVFLDIYFVKNKSNLLRYNNKLIYLEN